MRYVVWRVDIHQRACVLHVMRAVMRGMALNQCFGAQVTAQGCKLGPKRPAKNDRMPGLSGMAGSPDRIVGSLLLKCS